MGIGNCRWGDGSVVRRLQRTRADLVTLQWSYKDEHRQVGSKCPDDLP